MKLTDEIIIQALSCDKNIFLSSWIGSFILIGIAMVISFFISFPWIMQYFKMRKIKRAVFNIIVLIAFCILILYIPFRVGIYNKTQYELYNNAIEHRTFGVLPTKIEDKKIENYSWILKDFGIIEVTKNNYHNFEKGENIYIVGIMGKDGKYLFTDWIYSGSEYYIE